MTIKRRDFQKAAALIHEFQLKLSEDAECAELRDALNLSLLHMQRYYRKLRNRLQQNQEKQLTNGSHVLSQSLRGLSPMTPFRDTPDKFCWKWVNLESPKLTNTLPADLNKELSTLPLIIQAAKQGDNDMLMQHLEHDPDCIFEIDGIGRNALMYAVNFGHLDTVQILLENGIEANAVAHDGSTALHRACHNGNHEAVQIMVEYEANLNIQDSQGRYPIHWACAYPRRDCLKLLLDRGVDTSVKDHDGLTPCMWACRMDNIDHFELLAPSLDPQEGDGFERDLSGKTWMHWSVRRTDPHECLKTLLTEESANLKDDEGKTVIHCASETGSLSAVKISIEIAGKSILEHRDRDDRTPLILATMGGHGEIVNFLLCEGADLACVDRNGATAWDYACNRQLHYCMLILASYIRQRAKDESQDTKDLPNGTDMSNGLITEDTLGLNHLQINGGDTPMLYGHKPIPPPHPPSEGMTPRTPRTPRQATSRGVYTQRGHHYGAQNSSHPPSPQGGTRAQGGVKRSTSTNGSVEEEVFFERNRQKPSSAGHKRVKSEQSPDREALMSVMSVESQDQGSSRTHSATSRPYTPANQGNAEEEEIPNDSQYIDGQEDDNSRVSIDAMDVSDFDGDPEATDGDDEQDADSSPTAGRYTSQNHDYQPQYHPEPAPQPPPKPHPRHQAPFSYAPSKVSQPPYKQQGAPPAGPPHPKAKGPKANPHYSRGKPPGGHSGSGDYDVGLDPDDGEQINGDLPYQDTGPSRTNFPPGGAPPSDHRVPPPAHLSPLQSGAMPAPKKKKKKKKKDQPPHPEEYSSPSRGYVAPIPPPLHPNHPPPPTPQPRERSPPRGGGLMNDRGGGLSNTLHANVRPNSGALSKPTPKKRSPGAGSEHEQRFQGLNAQSRIGSQDSQGQGPQEDYEDRGQRARSFRQGQGQTRPGSGKKLQQPLVQNGAVSNGIHGQSGLLNQNGPTHKRPPSGNRRDGSPAPRDKHPPSPRSRRPPSGSLGGVSQQNPPWSKKQLPNGRLPPSYGLQ